ncbi:MAG: RNA polymerase sigma factor [Pseudomonadota bacterium]
MRGKRRHLEQNVVILDAAAYARRDSIIARLVRDHDAALRRYLRVRLTAEEDREDILQDVYFRVAQQQKSGRPLDNPRAYLLKTAANLLCDRARRRAVRQSDAHVPLDAAEVVEATTPETLLQSKQGIALIRAAVLALPEPQRSVFLMSRYGNKTYREIAAHFGVSMSMVEKHVANALRALRACLGDLA